MIIDYETPECEVVAFFGAQVICSSPSSSWEDVDREDDDDW
jgi:hypothetical protein